MNFSADVSLSRDHLSNPIVILRKALAGQVLLCSFGDDHVVYNNGIDEENKLIDFIRSGIAIVIF